MARPAPLSTEDAMPKFAGMLDMTKSAPLLSGLEIISEREFDTNSLEYEAFMQTPMAIRIHETGDTRVAPVVAVGCNGDQRWLPRGVVIKIQRKFVENLARSKEMHLRTEKNPDRESDDGMVTRRSVSSPYGFEILWDGQPKGRAWFERIMAEAQ